MNYGVEQGYLFIKGPFLELNFCNYVKLNEVGKRVLLGTRWYAITVVGKTSRNGYVQITTNIFSSYYLQFALLPTYAISLGKTYEKLL